MNISIYSCQFSSICFQAAESKPPSKPVKKETKKEKKEMSLLDLDDCKFFSFVLVFCSERERWSNDAHFSKAKPTDKDICSHVTISKKITVTVDVLDLLLCQLFWQLDKEKLKCVPTRDNITNRWIQSGLTYVNISDVTHVSSFFSVEPAPSPQVTPVNSFLSNSLVTDLEGLSLSDAVLSPAVSPQNIKCLILY